MLAALAGLAALTNWVAVERKSKPLEYVAKPATTFFILLSALTLTPDHGIVRAWFVVALLFCLAGDVFLMLKESYFVPGLVSFFVAHVCFIVGFIADPASPGAAYGFIVAFVFAFLFGIGRPIAAGARETDPRLYWPVNAYMAILAAMLATSFATSSSVAALGAAVFVSSDYILARNRFVRPLPHGHLMTMVTYHTALALLTLSLVV